MKKINVLDKGYVILHDVMGSDLTVVNAARVSFNKRKEVMDEKDEKLIKYLAKNDHTSPFRHAILQFEIYAPLMTARQHWKYVVGSDHVMDAWNESSRRYVTEEPEFYIPKEDEWRKAPENKKQGSGETMSAQEGYINTYELMKVIDTAVAHYERAIKRGVAVEQARLFLPAYAMYVRYYWTASLQSVAHFIKQRTAEDAQKEIQEYAKAVKELAMEKFPISLKELLKEGV